MSVLDELDRRCLSLYFDFRQKRQVQTWGAVLSVPGQIRERNAMAVKGSCFDLNILALLNSILEKNTV